MRSSERNDVGVVELLLAIQKSIKQATKLPTLSLQRLTHANSLAIFSVFVQWCSMMGKFVLRSVCSTANTSNHSSMVCCSSGVSASWTAMGKIKFF